MGRTQRHHAHRRAGAFGGGLSVGTNDGSDERPADHVPFARLAVGDVGAHERGDRGGLCRQFGRTLLGFLRAGVEFRDLGLGQGGPGVQVGDLGFGEVGSRGQVGNLRLRCGGTCLGGFRGRASGGCPGAGFRDLGHGAQLGGFGLRLGGLDAGVIGRRRSGGLGRVHLDHLRLRFGFPCGGRFCFGLLGRLGRSLRRSLRRSLSLCRVCGLLLFRCRGGVRFGGGFDRRGVDVLGGSLQRTIVLVVLLADGRRFRPGRGTAMPPARTAGGIEVVHPHDDDSIGHGPSSGQPEDPSRHSLYISVGPQAPVAVSAAGRPRPAAAAIRPRVMSARACSDSGGSRRSWRHHGPTPAPARPPVRG